MSSGRVEFFLSASDLTAHHAFVAVYIKNLETKEWNEIGRTEISYNPNPRFANQFIVPFVFEEEQQLRFDIYRAVQNQTAVISKNIIGSAAFKLSEVVHAKHQMLTRTLTKGRKVVKNRASKRYSRLNIRLEPLNEDIVDNVAFNFEASNLPKQGAFSKSNAILEIHRLGSDGKFFKIHETEVAKKTLQPNWSEFTLTSTILCNGDAKRTLQLKVYHADKDQRKYIGKCQTDYDKLLNDADKDFALKDPKGKQCGTLRLTKIRVLARQQNAQQQPQQQQPQQQQHYEQAQSDLEQKLQHDAIRKLQEAKSNRSRGKFLTYLQGNCELSLMVAVDFTGSNGYASDPNSLHHIYQPTRPSPYQAALRSICSILAQYDTDQKFPVWGFGAKFPQHTQVAHDFPVNPDGEEVDGVSGIESAYVTAIQSNAFQFSGPCCYSPILTKAINETIGAHNRVMQDTNESIQYYILLVLTNGQICEQDKQPTKNLLIYASNQNLPLSIIFVGIGDGDFAFLNELDGDFEPIQDDQGNTAKRDIVQFVAMKEFVDKDRHELSRYTLREIPIQFVSYVDNNRLEPRKKQMFLMKRTASKYFQEDLEDEDGNVEHQKGDTMYQISDDELATDSEEDEEDEKSEAAASPQTTAASDNMSNVPVPVGWEKGYTASGRPFYINHKTRSTQWNHPLKDQMQQPKSSQELSELQQKQAAAYNVQLMNNSLDYGNTKSTATAITHKPIQRQATMLTAQFAQSAAPQQALLQQRSSASLQPQRTQSIYAQPQARPQQVVQPQAQPQQRVVYAQPQASQQQRVVYAQPQQPQQRVVYDQFGRQVVLPMRAQPQPQQVVYAQPYGQPQQRVVYAQPQAQQQRVVYAQPQQIQYGQPQQRVVYGQPQQQIVYQQQPKPQFRQQY